MVGVRKGQGCGTTASASARCLQGCNCQASTSLSSWLHLQRDVCGTDLGDAVVEGVGPEAVAAVLGGGPHAILGPVLVDGGIVQEASLRLDLQPKMDRLKEAKQTLQ